jgi:hypothetical protein
LPTEALARNEAGLDLGGVEPAGVLRGVANSEAAPEPPAIELAQDLCQRDLRMNVQVIEHEMNPPRVPIAQSNLL